ncbi:MAG: MFS transporter [Dysgonamonadaceae bacterium]|jgi:FSR family fosmidomycin resistance protein-like MFS transporter|nr:MFS transporter [Dysgonamonadaceae bacterium]
MNKDTRYRPEHLHRIRNYSKNIVGGTAFTVLLALSFSHLLNDTLQSLIPAIYPILKDSLQLSFTQIGLITLVFQFASSMLQPVVGWYTDRHPQPWSLPVGMCFTMLGIFSLSLADNFYWVLVSVALTGIGSSIFHPEASRLAYMASGGKYGTAQSLFQVGGNLGGSLGSLLAAMVIVPLGQGSIKWFCIVAFIAVCVMLKISRWYKRNIHRLKPKSQDSVAIATPPPFSRRKIAGSLAILLMLVFSKYFYLASINSYYTFYLMDKFHVSIRESQFYLFAFLFAVAAGTLVGGPVGDRIGRKYVIWISILGVAPFTLLMPYANLFWTCILSVCIGLILSSAFSAILVYAQELLPGKVGMIAGLFFGLAFGIAGIASAVWGQLADAAGIGYVYRICSFLPLIGLITVFLPDIKRKPA